MEKLRLIIYLLIVLCLSRCHTGSELKRVFYINSYHLGYGSSDDVMEGIKEGLYDKVDLKVFYMDTKRKSDSKSIEETVNDALDQIKDFQPDLIIASDDNAVKFVIEPHFNNHEIPVVYCGVNWSADQYHLSPTTVTGMLEVLPFTETVEITKKSFPDIKILTVLSENTTSEQKNKEVMSPFFQQLQLEVKFSLVDDFNAWKKEFMIANEQSDLIYIPTNGAIKNWEEQAGKEFVLVNTKKPVITCDDFMMPYAVFGLTKVAKEQGTWAAEVALKILNGQKVSSIPIAKNKQYVPWVNKSLLEKTGMNLDPILLEKANMIE